MELGVLKIRYIMMSRRVMYLQSILIRGDNDLVRQYLMAQRNHPTKGDFTVMVMDDMKRLGLFLQDTEITAMGKVNLKKLIKNKLKQMALDDHNNNVRKLNKIKNIPYKDLKIQEYLVSPSFNDQQQRLMIQLRSKMINVKMNFKNKYEDTSCPLQCGLV